MVGDGAKSEPTAKGSENKNNNVGILGSDARDDLFG